MILPPNTCHRCGRQGVHHLPGDPDDRVYCVARACVLSAWVVEYTRRLAIERSPTP